MGTAIDTDFDVYSDTPLNRDPDSYSPTLRRYHKMLWSRPLPDGGLFALSDWTPKTYLYHQSLGGSFHLSSDSIGHTYRYVKAMAQIVAQVSEDELTQFFSICSTVGAYILFPSNRVDGKPTINGARGLHPQIRDRFDLTLECIRLHYQNGDSPIGPVLARYADFFDLFRSFQGYVDFFLLQDMVAGDSTAIDFFLPFTSFDQPPLPADLDAYRAYKRKVTAFITARNRRIAAMPV